MKLVIQVNMKRSYHFETNQINIEKIKTKKKGEQPWEVIFQCFITHILHQ